MFSDFLQSIYTASYLWGAAILKAHIAWKLSMGAALFLLMSELRGDSVLYYQVCHSWK